MRINQLQNISELISNKLLSHGRLPALYYQGKVYTYRQLWYHSYQIALYLQKIKAKKVIILSERNDFAYIAIIACAIAGVIFIPMNITLTIYQNLSLCETVQPDCILVSKWQQRFIKLAEIAPIYMIELLIHAEISKSFVMNKKFQKSSIATIFYTSGSTGRPKGIALTHANILSYIDNILSRYTLHPSDSFLQIIEMTFDPVLHDLFVCWAVGGCLFVFSAPCLAGLHRFILNYKITVYSSVPSTALLLLKFCLSKQIILPSLKWSFFGGETLTYEFCHHWQQIAPNSHIVNCYGPTEATIAVMSYHLDPAQKNIWCKHGICPIGKPFTDIALRLVNHNNISAKSLHIGECWLSGPQIIKSYLNLTKSENQFICLDNKYWYKTGDILRQDLNGNYFFVGRIDFQIKIGGYRVDPSEVEYLISQAANTLSVAVVVISGLQNSRIYYKNILIAYIANTVLSLSEISGRVRKMLPFYMIPHKIILVSELPKNSNGKTNYKKLKENYLLILSETSDFFFNGLI